MRSPVIARENGQRHSRLADAARPPQVAALPSPSTLPSPGAPHWCVTRRLPGSGRLALFRVAAPGQIAPGCYVLKATHASGDALAAALVRREALVTSQVVHPNLATVLGSDVNANPAYELLPYYEGLSLHRLLNCKSSLPVVYVLSLARQIAGALGALHAAGWLHGQIRPQHVIVSPQGQTTLIDLTLARRLKSNECLRDNAALVDRNFCLICAAPECFATRGGLTAASDIYSLGIVLFKALAGRPPFEATDRQGLVLAHRTVAPLDLRQLRPRLSLEIAQLVRRMLAKEPLRRPAASEVERWLLELEIEELAH